MATTSEIGAGRVIWHRVTLRQPGRLVHITPGPTGDHRPLKRS